MSELNPGDYIGKKVVVETSNARWDGVAVAYSDKPSVLIETADGARLMLPATCVRLEEQPKPWHEAKQNELWELRIEHCYESEVYRFAQDTTCADSGVFRPVNNPKRVFFDPKSPLIEVGRRIWPEVSDA